MRFHMNERDNNNVEGNVVTTSAQQVTADTLTTTTTTSDITQRNLRENDTSVTGEGAVEHIRKFVFTNFNYRSDSLQSQRVARTGVGSLALNNSEVYEKLEIKIPELLQGGYSFYTWPCAPILAWFLWERRRVLEGKRVLELGAGTALPGILAAKCGAHVVLSDNCIQPKSLSHIRKCCLANDLIPGQDIHVTGLSWGLLLNSVFNLGALDLIIAADCFYDPAVFEDIIVTVAFLLERNPGSKFIFTYQERSADWQIEALLKKWKLCALPVHIDDIGKNSGLDLLELMGGHTIHLIEVTRA